MVEDLFRIILGAASENGITTIDRVNVVIGEYLQIRPSIFEFAFKAAREGTIAGEAELLIEIEPVQLGCENCRHKFMLRQLKYECPHCGSGRLEILQGKELYIKSIEGE